MQPLLVRDRDVTLSIDFHDVRKYHGTGFIGGAAHGYAAMARAWPLLSDDGPPIRKHLAVETAFPGPGARDAIEMVTRCVTAGRYAVEDAFAPPGTIESPKGRYFWRFLYRDRAVAVRLKPGIVRDEFIRLSRQGAASAEEEARLDWLKQDMAVRILAAAPAEVYEVVSGP